MGGWIVSKAQKLTKWFENNRKLLVRKQELTIEQNARGLRRRIVGINSCIGLGQPNSLRKTDVWRSKAIHTPSIGFSAEKQQASQPMKDNGKKERQKVKCERTAKQEISLCAGIWGIRRVRRGRVQRPFWGWCFGLRSIRGWSGRARPSNWPAWR